MRNPWDFAIISKKKWEECSVEIDIEPGRYRHYKGGEYEVIGMARHSETEEPLVIYRALYGEGLLWARPAAMWNETVLVKGVPVLRFTKIGEV